MRIGGFGLAIILTTATACTNEPPKHVTTIQQVSIAAPDGDPQPRATAPVFTDYPPRYPILDEVELGRRTSMAEAATPGWHIALDPLGLLSTAVCREACPGAPAAPPSADDRAKVGRFLATKTSSSRPNHEPSRRGRRASASFIRRPVHSGPSPRSASSDSSAAPPSSEWPRV